MVICCMLFLLYVSDYKLKKNVKMNLQVLVTLPHGESQCFLVHKMHLDYTLSHSSEQ